MPNEVLHTMLDGLRVVNILLSVWLLVRLYRVRRQKWKTTYTEKERRAWTSYLVVGIAIGEGTLEVLFLGYVGGPRTLITFLAAVSILWVLYTPDDRQNIIIQSS